MGWTKELSPEALDFCKEYIGYREGDDFNWVMIRQLMATVCDTAIVQAQDLLGLDENARMNAPSTVGRNWQWMAEDGCFTDDIKERLKELTHVYGRA